MCEGSIEFFGTCVRLSTLLFWMVVIGATLIGVGTWLYRISRLSEEDLDEDVVEDEEYQHPYLPEEKVFAGEYEGIGVKIEILYYVEEEMEVRCKLHIEAPVGATEIEVDHTFEGDYSLGYAIINFTLGGNAELVRVPLYDEALVECDYNVVIETAKSTFEDIKE